MYVLTQTVGGKSGMVYLEPAAAIQSEVWVEPTVQRNGDSVFVLTAWARYFKPGNTRTRVGGGLKFCQQVWLLRCRDGEKLRC